MCFASIKAGAQAEIARSEAAAGWLRTTTSPECGRVGRLRSPRLLLLAAGLFVAANRRQESKSLAEFADLHVANLASANPVEVVSTDRHTVKPWFQGRIPFTFDAARTAGLAVHAGRRPRCLFPSGARRAPGLSLPAPPHFRFHFPRNIAARSAGVVLPESGIVVHTSHVDPGRPALRRDWGRGCGYNSAVDGTRAQRSVGDARIVVQRTPSILGHFVMPLTDFPPIAGRLGNCAHSLLLRDELMITSSPGRRRSLPF